MLDILTFMCYADKTVVKTRFLLQQLKIFMNFRLFWRKILDK